MATEAQLLRRHGGLRSRFASIGAVLLWCSLSGMMAATSTHSDENMRQRDETQMDLEASTKPDSSENTVRATASNQSGNEESQEGNGKTGNMEEPQSQQQVIEFIRVRKSSESDSAKVDNPAEPKGTQPIGNETPQRPEGVTVKQKREAEEQTRKLHPDNQESKASDDQGSVPDTGKVPHRKGPAKESNRSKLKSYVYSGFSAIKRAFDRLRHGRECEATEEDPIWHFIKDVSISVSEKYIICANLQERLDEFVIKLSRPRNPRPIPGNAPGGNAPRSTMP